MTGNVQFAEAIEQAGLPSSTPICVARPNGVAKVHPQYGIEEHALEYAAALARHTADPLPVVLHALRDAAQQFIDTAATTLKEDEDMLHNLQQNQFLMYVSCDTVCAVALRCAWFRSACVCHHLVLVILALSTEMSTLLAWPSEPLRNAPSKAGLTILTSLAYERARTAS